MDELILLYSDLIGLNSTCFTPFDHEEALVAAVFKISRQDGPDLVLKIFSSRRQFLREAFFLKHFAGKIPVPRVLQLIEGNEGVNAAILMESLPGKLLKTENLTTEIAEEIGSLLATIHRESAEGYGDLTVPERLSKDPRIPFRKKFEEGLEECRGHLADHLIQKCRDQFEEGIDLLLSADGPSMIHRDFRPGNLIIADNKVQGVIDWSSARGGCAEEDFCGIELEKWPVNYQTDLLKGYTSIRTLPNYRPLIPLLSLSKAVGVIGFTVKRGTWNGKDSKLYQKHLKILQN